MSVSAQLYGQHPSEVTVSVLDDRVTLKYLIDSTSGGGKGQFFLSVEAAESLYLKLGAALHGSDEPAREAAYLERQVKDAVENGLGTEGIPLMVEEPPQTWRWVDRETQGGENLD